MDWLLKFVKGVFIGSGFILPGVSGGALAAIFGIYEKIIAFLANITKDFKKNVLYFLPLGIGALSGIFLLAFPIDFLLLHYEVQVLWFFIGCILGTLPALWRQSGLKGRKPSSYIIMTVTIVLGFTFFKFGDQLFGNNLPQNFFTWLLAGSLIGLGMIVPGLSPSNFLLYMGLFRPMTEGIRELDFSIIIPVSAGIAVTVSGLSKIMKIIFKRAYTGLFHFIMGIVIASTVIIIPTDYNYLRFAALICPITCGLGIALGWWMSNLEKKYEKYVKKNVP